MPRCLSLTSLFALFQLFGTAAAPELRVADNLNKLPLAFEANQGQAGKSVDFLARGAGYSVSLSHGSARITLRHERSGIPAAVQLRLEGARRDPKATTRTALPGRVNYFLGNNPARWHVDIPTFSRVEYASVYRGIDLAYYGDQGRLEYDFIVAPGANLGAIRFAADGARNVHLGDNGDLVLETAAGPVGFRKPVAYQQIAGTRHAVESRYKVTDGNTVRFAIGAYDPAYPLVIDPSLVYSTYLGGSNDDSGSAIAVDSQGNAYITGTTSSMDFPLVDAEQSFYTGSPAIFVSKLSADGSSLIYSTYLGSSGNYPNSDTAYSIAVDSNGSAYVVGTTYSTNFPLKNPLYPTLNGLSDAFVTKFSPEGNALIYSTYLGGSGGDGATGVAVDAARNAYIAGGTSSSDFPATPGAYQTSSNESCSFVTKLNAAGSALTWSTYFGDDCSAQVRAIAVDSEAGVYLTGFAVSGLPVTAGAPQQTFGGDVDAFLAKLNNTGATLAYCTYLGGSLNDYGQAIAVDSAGSAYIAGYTTSTNLPVTASAIQGANGGGTDAFVAKLNSAGTKWQYVSYLGGLRDDYAWGIAVDSSGRAIVAGGTDSTNFPRASVLQPSLAGNQIAISRTANGGSSWTAAQSGFPGPIEYAGSIVIDPAASTHLLAVSTDGGLYQSTDSGGHWTANSSFPQSGGYVYTLAFSADGGTLYAGGDLSGLYSSSDGGTTWTLAGYLPYDPFCAALNITVDPTAASTLYVGGGSIYWGLTCSVKSTNGGVDWTVFNDPIASAIVTGFAVNPQAPNTVYAASFTGVFESADGGQTWATLNIAGLESPYVSAVTIDPSQPELVYAAANGSVYRSSDAGNSWTLMSTGVTAYVYYLAIAPSNPAVLYAGTTSGMFVSENGATSWSRAGLAQDQIWGIAVNPSAPASAYAMTAVYPDAFVAEINPAGNALVYSTYLGGSNGDVAYAVAVNSAGDAIVTGSTGSRDFPIIPGAFQTSTVSESTALVARIGSTTPACIYTTSPAAGFFYPAGGSASYSVVAPSGCAWTPTPSASWITIIRGTGPGVAPLGIEVAANTGAPRSGTIALGTATISISQAAGDCTYALSTNSLTFPQAGGSLSVGVTANNNCHWNVTGLPPWLTITAGASGNGNGAVTLEAAPNLFPGARTSYTPTIDIANRNSSGGQGRGGSREGAVVRRR
jgi:hypothetical protein